jgi:hypothetical protein
MALASIFGVALGSVALGFGEIPAEAPAPPEIPAHAEALFLGGPIGGSVIGYGLVPEPFEAGGTLAILAAEGAIAAQVSATIDAPLSGLTAESDALFQSFRPTIDSADIPSYTAALTDPSSGLADVPIKISSLQLRYRENGSGYINVVVPNGISHVEDMLARPNAKVVVSFAQGAVSDEIGRFTPAYIRTDEGHSSQSLTLSGDLENISIGSGSAVELDFVSYVAVTSDAVRYRAPVRGDIKPGDSIKYGATVGIVKSISLYVSAGASQMEIET